ncbi:pyridoxamine 5'-phosphate oxidase family protein [Formosa sp. L2A11]|uniref:pyridoxamine 5'-phosphate oxidase family protein n=1 Tax=Formosa sp. L2A11 TaxID=2686363 RepID=UPI00131AB7CC|nr:pyridoxamine 5'-phosphate oxidase family protein [Formosa sp. L2A11]
MGKKTDHIAPHIAEFIKNQHLFFVGTAANEGRVNLSPKGTDSFRVINKNKIIWLNLTGSGNETAAHLLQNNRMTIMFCAFEGKPLILRLYGNATIFHPRDKAFKTYSAHFPKAVGSRQIIEMDVDLVQTSCGFGVPFMNYKEERSTLDEWAEQKGQDGIKQYWKDKNTKSIDGFETEIIK